MDSAHRKDLIASYKDKKKVGGICALQNTVTGKMLVSAVSDLEGYKNRFSFSQSTGSCVLPKLAADWSKYGPTSFSLTVLDTLEKKETQTDREFADDIAALLELRLEKIDPSGLY